MGAYLCGTYAIGKNVYVTTMDPPILNVEEQGEGHEWEIRQKIG